MKILRITTLTCWTLMLLAPHVATARAALPIDLEVAKEPGLQITAPQEWAQLLGRMGLGSVRLRDVRSGDRPKVDEKKLGRGTRYQVLSILNRRGELVLPERRFRTSDRKALQKYFDELPARAAYNAEDRGRFGLTEKQFRQIYAELSQTIGFSTKGKSTREILSRLKKTLTVPIIGSSKAASRNGNPLASELQELSAGTGLAIALRHEGLMMLPEQLPGQTLRLSIEAYDARKESWPVGWLPAISSRKSAPQLFELRNIELSGFTLSQALTALGPALKIPVITDEWILEQRQIDPSKIQVSLPKRRTFLKSAVSKLLSQARLAEEVRVDELDQPFLWITRFGKNSPAATK